jgi:O-antigen/teichoic acid export membrane protein
LSAVEDQLSVTDDGVSVADDQPGAADDPQGGADDRQGAADDPQGGADDRQGAADDHLSTPEVRRRAVTGAVVDALRGIGIRLVGLIGTAVTARLLTPYDFGLVAFGATVLVFGSFVADGGVGTALIRRPEPPTKSELQALVAFQLGLDVVLVVGVGLVMLPLGLLGEVTAVMIIALPLTALRAPAYIIYERRLNYRPMAIVEIVETTVYYVWAIVGISVGWGVWGLATAAVARALVGSVLLMTFLPEGRLVPVPSWSKVKTLLGFGFRYQAVGLLQMLRDQGVNIVVATFGGVAVLGLWGVAWRILQIPYSFFVALWRVSFPGMSRLVAAQEDVGGTIERVIAVVAVGTGVLVAPLAASAAAWIHVLIGAQWADAASAIPAACFAMMFGVPISVALAGYLWAIGSASIPLRAALLGLPAMAIVLLPLLPVIGVVAVGLSYVTSALVESALFIYGARRTTSFEIGRRLAIPVLIATVAAACGWFVARGIGLDLAGAVSSSAVALGLFVGGLAAVQRADLTDAWSLVARGLRGAVAAPSRA